MRNFKWLFIYVFVLVVFFSCLPDTYTYYPSTRKLSRNFNKDDTVFIISPYANFAVTGENDIVLSTDTSMARMIQNTAEGYFLNSFSGKFKSKRLYLGDTDRDTLAFRFFKLINNLYQTKSGDYKVKMDVPKKGYVLMCWIDCLVRDHWLYVYLGGYHGSQVRFITRYHLCLIDAVSGKVVDYKYHYHLYDGLFDSDNKCTSQKGLQEVLLKNLTKVSSHLLKSSRRSA
jgi:hypothetical protein